MAEIFYFKPKSHVDAAINLKEFIKRCKFELTVFGEDLKWDEWRWPKVVCFTKIGVHSRTKNVNDILDISFIDFAKAYLRYQQGNNPTVAKNELRALRAIEVALLQGSEGADIQNLSISILDEAAQVMKKHYAVSAAYHGGRELERLAKFVTEKKLIPRDVDGWRNPISRKNSSVQTGKKAKARREKMLPSDEALSALAEIFANNPTDPRDIFTTATFVMTMCAPSRISEILVLPNDCEIEEVDSKGKLRYGWRFYSGKGYGANIKWVPTEMVGVAKEAIKRIQLLTEESRNLAKWIEKNPEKFYRHAQCPDVEDDYPLTSKQACQSLGLAYDSDASARSALHGMGIPYNNGENTLNSLCQYALSRQPKGFPWLSKIKKIKYSNALFCMQRKLLATRSTSHVILWSPTNNVFNNDLSPKKGNEDRQTIFDRYGYKEADGSRIKLTSKQARHLLNTIAQRGGLSQLEIASWSGRADPKQNRVYNHMSEYEMVAKAEALNTSVSLFGPDGDVEKHLPISIQEFNTLEKGAVHVTEFGVCVHDFTMTPCEKYRDCINCHEQVCIKGDKEKLIRIKTRLAEVKKQFQEAEIALDQGLAGADRWYEYHKNTLKHLLELVSILKNPSIEKGAQIKLRNDKSFSPLRRAIESKRSEKQEDNSEKNILDDMTKLLGGGFG